MNNRCLSCLVIIVAIVFYCYEFYLRIFPSTILGPLMLHFNVTPLVITEILASYYLSYALGQLPAGIILDRYGANRVLPLAGLISVLGLLIFIGSKEPILAELGRIVLGLGSAFALLGVLKMTRDYLPARYFSRVVGITIALGTLMAANVEVISMRFVAGSNWMMLFAGSIVIGLILSLVLWLGMKKLIRPFDESHALTWGQMWQELKVLLKNKPLWLNASIGGLFYAPTSALAALYGSYFLSHHYAFSPDRSAYCISLLFLGWAVGSPLVGWISDKIHYELPIIRSCALFASAISFTIVSAHVEKTDYIELLMFLFGFFSSAQILVWKLFNSLVPSHAAGTGAALTNMLIMIIVGGVQLLFGYGLMLWSNGCAILILPLCLAATIFISFLAK
ncbi:MAG: MFS transporter [Gammaproteobacteria bacterium]|nr:MFS transporter [Gammaproteobacteria bacterium]